MLVVGPPSSHLGATAGNKLRCGLTWARTCSVAFRSLRHHHARHTGSCGLLLLLLLLAQLQHGLWWTLGQAPRQGRVRCALHGISSAGFCAAAYGPGVLCVRGAYVSSASQADSFPALGLE